MKPMKLKMLLAVGLLAVSNAAFADGRFERTLNVSATPDLYVTNGAGNITVHAGGGSQIHIVARLRSGWNLLGGSDDALIQRIEAHPPIVQEGNTVRVGDLAGLTGHDTSNHIDIEYDITTPVGTALNLHSGSGDIATEGVGRFLAASSGSGNLQVRGLTGPAELVSGSGDIELDQAGQGDVKARTGSGNIHIHGLQGTLTARTGSGNIEAEGRLNGPAQLENGSGNITLRLGPDAHFNLEASTGSGDIRVRYPGAPQQGENSRHHMTAPIHGGGPPLQVRTGSGNIEIAS